MKTLLKKIFRFPPKEKMVDNTAYRLLRMNRKLMRPGK